IPAQRKSTWRCKRVRCSVALAAWKVTSAANRLGRGPRMVTRVLIHGASKRDPRLPDVPTVYEVMERQHVPDVTRRLATVLMSPDLIGRPLIAPPRVPADRLTMLRDGLMKALKDPEFIAEAQKRNWEVEPVSGQELESIAKKVVVQPPEVIERMKKILTT